MAQWLANIMEHIMDFANILNASIAASWMVLAVIVLRFLLKKAPKWTHVALWGLVAVRLLLPFSIESSLSLIPSTETIPQEMLMYQGEQLRDSAFLDIVSNPAFSESVTVEVGKTVDRVQISLLKMTPIWIAGMGALLIYTAVSYWRLRRKVSEAVILRDNIFQSENVGSPFVLGIFKPRIYLPYNMNGQDLGHVVAHEQAHIRSRDHWWKPLGFLLLTIHWFNPLMWLAYVLLCRDIELACDEKVIKELGNEQRADYTQALVACSVGRRMIAACPLAFGEVGVKERVKSVMNYKKPAFWIIILSVVACVGVAVCFLTNPKQDSYTLRIVIPAGSQEEFVYSDEEVSTIKNSIKIWSGDGLGDTEVLLSPVNETTETGYTATYLTHGMPVEFDAEKGTWFKVGVNIQNPSDEDIIVYVEVENVEVRIEDEVNSVKEPDLSFLNYENAISLVADVDEVMAIYCPSSDDGSGGSIQVGAATGTDLAKQLDRWDWKECSAPRQTLPSPGSVEFIIEEDYRITVHQRKSGSLRQYAVVKYQDDIRYYSIDKSDYSDAVALVHTPNDATNSDEMSSTSNETWDLIPMVMVNGTLYLDTGHESDVAERTDHFDGEITSQVDGKPSIDDQSNFGTGYGYQYGATEGTIDLFMNGKWRIFATEEARKEIQFPSTEAEPSNSDFNTDNSEVSGIALSDGGAELKVDPQIADIQLTESSIYTNTERIVISADNLSGETEIEVYLYSTDDLDNPIRTETLYANAKTVEFTGLTSRFEYIVGARIVSADETVTLKITD